MVDESMDKEAMKQPPQPWEYRSKKAYQRLLIMLGGIIMNLLTAMVIYAVVFGVWGEEYLPTENAKYGIAADSVAESIGLRDGDKIVSVGGQPVERFNSIVKDIIFNEANTMQVIRDGQTVDIPLPAGTIRKLTKRQRLSVITPRMPTVVDEVSAKSAAEEIGLKKGDSIIAGNGSPMAFYDQFEDWKKANAGKKVEITVMRGNAPVVLAGVVPENGILGFQRDYIITNYFETEVVKYGFIDAIGKGFSYTSEQVGNYWNGLKFLFTSPEVKVSENLGGLVSFGKMFSPVFDWQDFLMLTAFVSIILAIMNLLPIPGLDGGYVIFLIFEMLSGRKVSDKVMETANTVGLVLLLGLMLYANGMDIFRLFK
jgi:regulator of sigma E protease